MIEGPPTSGRVVITGIGMITPLGTGAERSWERIVRAENAVDRVSHFDISEFSTQVAAEVRDFNAADWLDAKEAKRMDRFICFAAAAAQMALDDACFPKDDDLRRETGVLIGSGIGGLTFLGEQHRRQIDGGPSRVSPFLVPYMIPDMASGYVSILHGLKGPNSCIVSACATGANSIGEAAHMIRRGDAQAMLAGGAEAPINEIGMAGFCAMRAMSTRNDDPKHASRPFDKERDGFIISEGSAVVVLEDYDRAKARNAKIYGEVLGYGISGDAFHITQPDSDGDGAYRSMKMALRTAGIDPGEVDYINAHGTSTPYNDRLETHAIKRVFAKPPPVSSTKSQIGHSLGAAGAIEAVVCLLAMRDGTLPPTINYETADPDCDLDYVPNASRKANCDIALSNSFGFGGHNVTLIFGKAA